MKKLRKYGGDKYVGQNNCAMRLICGQILRSACSAYYMFIIGKVLKTKGLEIKYEFFCAGLCSFGAISFQTILLNSKLIFIFTYSASRFA